MEINALKAELITRINRLKNKRITSLEDYYEAEIEIEDIAIELDYLNFLIESVSGAPFFAEFLSEGSSLYAFIGNDSLNNWDVLGEAKGGKQNVKTTGGGDSIADQKASGERNKQKRANDKRNPPKTKEQKKEEKRKKKEKNRQKQQSNGLSNTEWCLIGAAAVGLSLLDGPLPIGDAVAASLVGGALATQ